MWRESESMITRLITNTIGTGAAVAMCGLITLVLFVTSPEDSLQYLSGYVFHTASDVSIVDANTGFVPGPTFSENCEYNRSSSSREIAIDYMSAGTPTVLW